MNRLISGLFAVLLLVCAGAGVARAQTAEVVTTCGTVTLPVNSSTAKWHFYLDATGNLCVSAGVGGGGTGVTTTPGARTLVTLDFKTVTTGGTAVTAIAAGNRTAGGFLQNPGAVALCINEIGTATGATSSGDTTCIQQNQSYYITAAAGAVSVISSDSAHPFSGYGLK
jgi:hypothetical protein